LNIDKRMFETLQKEESRAQSADSSKAGVPNLGYMHPQGYICLSEGIHLRLSIEEKIYLHNILFPNSYTHISEYYFQKSLYACC